MKLLKLLLVFAVLIGIVVLGFNLLTGQEHVQVEQDGVTNVHHASLDAFINRFSDGWNETEYQSALNYIRMPERERDSLNLIDRLTNGVLYKLDSIVCGTFASNPSPSPISGNPALANAYEGVAYMARRHPVVESSAGYEKLMDYKDFYNRIYNFSVAGFVAGSSCGLTLRPVGSSYSIDWSEPQNYDTYKASQNNIRRQLITELGNRDVFAAVTWMPRALEERNFNERMNNGKLRYAERERRAAVDFFTGLSSDSRLAGNADARRSVAAELTAVASNLPALICTPDVLSAIELAKSRLSNE